MWELTQIALVYSLPGTWVNLDVSTFDYFADTGEVSWLGTRWAWLLTRWSWSTPRASPRCLTR